MAETSNNWGGHPAQQRGQLLGQPPWSAGPSWGHARGQGRPGSGSERRSLAGHHHWTYTIAWPGRGPANKHKRPVGAERPGTPPLALQPLIGAGGSGAGPARTRGAAAQDSRCGGESRAPERAQPPSQPWPMRMVTHGSPPPPTPPPGGAPPAPRSGALPSRDPAGGGAGRGAPGGPPGRPGGSVLTKLVGPGAPARRGGRRRGGGALCPAAVGRGAGPARGAGGAGGGAAGASRRLGVDASGGPAPGLGGAGGAGAAAPRAARREAGARRGQGAAEAGAAGGRRGGGGGGGGGAAEWAERGNGSGSARRLRNPAARPAPGFGNPAVSGPPPRGD